MSEGNISLQSLAPFGKQRTIAAIFVATMAVFIAAVAIESGQIEAFVVLLAAILILPAILWRWPVGAVATLFAAAAVPRISLKVFGLNMKVEHAIATLIAICFFLSFRTRLRKLSSSDYFLLGFLCITFASSALYSPQSGTTLKNAAIFTLAVLPYWILRELISDTDRLQKAMSLFFVIGALEAVYGIFCFIANALFDSKLGITFYYYLGSLTAVHASQWEPNIFGSYISAFAAMFLFLYMQRTSARRWYLAGLLLASVAALLSLARAAWIGLVVAAVMGLFFRAGFRNLVRRLLVPAIIASCFVALAVALAWRIDTVRERASSLSPDVVFEDPTLVHRMVFIDLAINDIAAHPWFGMGSNSFGVLWDWETDEGTEPAWVGNIFIRIWHDSGVVGLLLFLAFVGTLVSQAWKLFKRQRYTAIGSLAAALLVGLVVLTVAFQATEASTLAFTWVHLGLLRGFVGISQQTSPASIING